MTRGMGIGGMETTFAREGHAFRAGIREGERRMLWAIAVGAELDRDRFATITRYAHVGDRYHHFMRARCESSYAACVGALRALSDLGDEGASRVLGERGW